MPWWMWTIVAVYVAVAVAVFLLNATIGPVTLGLALMRALLWPFWLAGFVQGERLTMD